MLIGMSLTFVCWIVTHIGKYRFVVSFRYRIKPKFNISWGWENLGGGVPKKVIPPPATMLVEPILFVVYV